MAVVNFRSFTPTIWIPPAVTANFKLTVTRTDGTVDDVTDLITRFKVEDVVMSEGIGTFDFTIPDPSETYGNAWTGMEVVTLYIDYAATATTKRFTGRIEKPNRNDNFLRCSGRSEALFIFEKKVNESFENIDAGVVFETLINNYGDGRYTTSNINTSTGVLVTVKWQEKPFSDCIEELCKASICDALIDADLDAHFFVRNSRTNTDESIVHDMNIFSVGEFAPDHREIKNFIVVYGAEIEGQQIIKSAKDTTSISQYGERKHVIEDNNTRDPDQAQLIADATLTDLKDAVVVSDVRVIMLATIQPGQRIPASDPQNGITPTDYRVPRFVHEYDSGGIWTSVSLQKQVRDISHVLRERIRQQEDAKKTSINPFGMEQSEVYLFDVDSGSHTNTEITSGVLKPTTSSGNWISPITTGSTNVSQVYIVIDGEDVSNITFEVSGDSGVTYESITPKNLLTLSSSIGPDLRVKVTFSSSTASLDSLGIYFKRD